MTAQPIGAPDWLKGVQGSAHSLVTGNYSAPGSNTVTFGTFDVRAVRAIALAWIPQQDCALTVQFTDDPRGLGQGIQRVVTTGAAAYGQFTIPTLGPYATIFLTRLDGALNPTGSLTAASVSSTDRVSAGRGGLILVSNASLSAGAATTVTLRFTSAVEGMATMYLRSDATSWNLQIQALDATNQWNTITEMVPADAAAARFACALPALQCRLSFQNADAALKHAFIFASIGD